jgi:hypothetical protein
MTQDALVDAGPLTSTERDTTIRLVGGGGTTGTVDEELPPEDNLAEEVASGTSNESVQVQKGGKQPKHKKTLSSGLKKIGQLGIAGKRRTDSSSSVKDKE